ncbi:inositol monophosphatase family protein [Bauldia sp.]|uniref:inositol monophosphatase family protein n=1 Tax=Bauldia sp. TaxID=2575872 RepID=UPI0025BC952A|nr:inositol monophosphatase family protein [Bauldia sp.]
MVAEDIAARLRIAEAVVREAGALALDYFHRRHELKIDAKGLQDLVSQADRESEELIFARMSEAFPGDSFLGEEGGLRQKGPMMWVVDPIDGTANFVRGIPHWCVSIGLVSDHRAVLGAIYDPVADELFAAVAGGGATLNGEPIRVTGQTDIVHARIGLGFSYRSDAGRHSRDVRTILEAGCEYLRLGSGALGLAYTAAGRLDGYYERHINLWDVAGGLVVVAEAGGRSSDFLTPAAVSEGNELLVATPGLFDPLRRLLPAA